MGAMWPSPPALKRKGSVAASLIPCSSSKETVFSPSPTLKLLRFREIRDKISSRRNLGKVSAPASVQGAFCSSRPSLRGSNLFVQGFKMHVLTHQQAYISAKTNKPEQQLVDDEVLHISEKATFTWRGGSCYNHAKDRRI